MKKYRFYLTLILPVFILGACNIDNIDSSHTSSIENSSSLDSTLTSSEDFSSSSSIEFSENTSSSSEIISNQIIYDDVNLTASENEKEIVLDKSTFERVIGKYSTGNFMDNYDGDRINADGVYVEFYRAVKGDYDDILSLLPYQANQEDGSIGGALYNIEHINYISRVVIEYESSDDFKINFSLDNINWVEFDILPSSNNSRYVEIVFYDNNPSLFLIECTKAQLNIKDMKIFYEGEIGDTISYLNVNDGASRFNPIVNDPTTLIDGQTTLNIPISIDTSNYPYDVTYKEYTYYSTSYVLNHPEVKDNASFTDPLDVARYTIAFGVAPANYHIKNAYDLSDMVSVFGEDTRYCSYYSRTDGYVNAVPFNGGEYIECDIDIGGTYIDGNDIERGVGRIVVFLNGFDEIGYNSPVAVYTDDHYCTFQEYYNDGTFGARFNASCNRTSFIYDSGIETLSIN